jgi:hypothetical protein
VAPWARQGRGADACRSLCIPPVGFPPLIWQRAGTRKVGGSRTEP